MEEKVLNYIHEHRMLDEGDGVILGVSGGADSMCMLAMFAGFAGSMRLKLTVVHVNHHLRQDEADKDQKFVENFCGGIGIKCRVFDVDAKKEASARGCSLEEAGRIARYEAFERARVEEHSQKIAVAHNLNDSSETILFNLLRGSGIKGLSGIQPVRGNVIRPLLCLCRDEIERYLKDHNINFRTDSTNLSCDYTRNRLRNRVFPYAEEHICRGAVRHVAAAGERLSEIGRYIDAQTEKAYRDFVISAPDGYRVQNSIKGEDPVIITGVFRMCLENLCGSLKDITGTHISILMNLLEHGAGARVNLPRGVTALRDDGGILIALKSSPAADDEKKRYNKEFEAVIYSDGKPRENGLVSVSVETPERFLADISVKSCYEKAVGGDVSDNPCGLISDSADSIENGHAELSSDDIQNHESALADLPAADLMISESTNADLNTGTLNIPDRACTKWIDCDKIENTLVVRTRRPGDYLTVDASGSRKKLQDYFVNEKIPREKRDDILLVADGSHIVWVIGLRISAAYRITPRTRRVLKMTLKETVPARVPDTGLTEEA